MNAVVKKIYFLHQLFKFEDLFVGFSRVLIAGCFAVGGIPRSDLVRLGLAILFCILGLASINSLNQIFDADIDEINKPNRPIPSKKLTKKQVLIISFSLSLCAGLLTFYLGLTYFLIAVAGLTIGLIYCVPQVYAKKIPLFSTVVIAIGYGILMFMVGWKVYQPISSIPLWLLGFLFTHDMIIAISKDFSDLEGDLKEGVKTIPVIFGKKRGALLCFFLYLLPFIFLLTLQWTGYLATSFYPLVIMGIILGVSVFGLVSFDDKRYNYLGYLLAMITMIIVLIALFYSFVQL